MPVQVSNFKSFEKTTYYLRIKSMETLTQYIFFIDSNKNTLQIKPKRGTFVEENWAYELGTALTSFISSNTALSKAVSKSFAEKKNQVVELELTPFWIRVNLIFLEMENTQPNQLLVSIKRIDRDVINGSIQLQSRKEQEDFFAELTHEIRTSLNIILGNSRLIKTSPIAEQTQLIENTISASEQLLQLTNNYLGRIKSKEISRQKALETRNLMHFVHTVSHPFRPLAKAKNLEFESKIDPNLDENVEFMPSSVAQVINNLLSNAIAHTEKGKVTIHAALLEKTHQEMEVLVKVQDTGTGISKVDQELIFSRFVQLRPDIKEGSGLGLPITKKIIEDLGGQISVSSIPGSGSEFSFQFTVKRVLQSEKKPVTQDLCPNQYDLSGIGKIVVIDDNPVNLLIIKRQLAQLGVKADFFESGEDAIKSMPFNTYSLALVDMSMPQIDGLLLSAHIRQFYPDMKIAIFTAGNLDGKLQQLFALNISSFLTKPNTLEELRELLVMELIDRKPGFCLFRNQLSDHQP